VEKYPSSRVGADRYTVESGYYEAQQPLDHQYEARDESGELSVARGDPGEKLREPGDEDNTGDQRDGDRAGGQRKYEEYPRDSGARK
jgi:hypothetical protein